MHALVRAVSVAKSDHGESGNQDALKLDCSKGLFAIADGAGTTIFADLWARTLATSFVNEPLLSVDPFEVKWWLPTAQQKFDDQIPALETLPWNARNKLNLEGSQSTFLALRFFEIQESFAKAKLIAFGDSCAFLLQSGQPIVSFPAKGLSDLSVAPICLPSSKRVFSHGFHRGVEWEFKIGLGDSLVLMTDAVARYIFDSAHIESGDIAAALDEVTSLDADGWPKFVAEKRDSGQMIDDDCTVLRIQLCDPIDGAEGLGETQNISVDASSKRSADYVTAQAAGLRSSIALLWGDGIALGVANHLPPDDLARCRDVVNAIDAIETILRRTEYGANAQKAELELALHQYAELLLGEPSAQRIISVLSDLGVVPENKTEAPIPAQEDDTSSTP